MLVFFMLVFGKINPDDLVQSPSHPQFFKCGNIGAAAKNRQSAAEHVNILQDLVQKMSEQKQSKFIAKEYQKFQDYTLQNYLIDGHKILVAYYNKKTPSLIIKAYLSEVTNLSGVTDAALAQFDRLAAAAKDTKSSLWESISTRSRALFHQQSQVEKLKQEWETANTLFQTFSQKQDSNGLEPEKYTKIDEGRIQALHSYWEYGGKNFEDLDEDEKKSLLSSVCFADYVSGSTFLVLSNLQDKFIPTVHTLLQEEVIKCVKLINDGQDLDTMLIENFLTHNVSQQFPVPFIATLKNKEEIEEIDLNNVKIDLDMIGILKGKKNLKKLNFNNCIFDDQAVAEFSKVLSTLKGLDELTELSNNFSSESTKSAFKNAIKEKGPIPIRYGGQTITVYGNLMFENPNVFARMREKIHQVTQGKSPQTFCYDADHVKLTAEALEKMLEILPNTLTSILIRNFEIDKQGFQKLLDWLKQKNSIKKLNIQVGEDVAMEDLGQLGEIFKDRDYEAVHVCRLSDENQHQIIYSL